MLGLCVSGACGCSYAQDVGKLFYHLLHVDVYKKAVVMTNDCEADFVLMFRSTLILLND